MTKFVGEQALIKLISKIKTNLNNYYLSSQVYTKTEVDNLVSAIPKFDIKVVASLPTNNISNSTIYLVTSGDDTNNLYDEYVYANSGTYENPTYSWEKLGTQAVDLSGYASKTDLSSSLSTALSDYYTKTETNNLLSSKANLTAVENIKNNTNNISGTNGGFAGGNGASCTGYGGAVGSSASSESGFAGGYSSTTTKGGAIGAGAKSTTGFAGGFNAIATADGAVQLGTGSNSTANTLKFRDTEIVRLDGKIESSNLKYQSGVVANSELPVKSKDIYTALQGKQDVLIFDTTPISNSSNLVTSGGVFSAIAEKQDAMTEISASEVETLFES